MDEKALDALEFYKITKRLENLANSPLGKAKCRDLSPSNDLAGVTSNLQNTTDALCRLLRNDNISFEGVSDLNDTLNQLKIGSIIGIEGLLSIQSLLDAALNAAKFFHNDDDDSDSLTDLFEGLNPLTALSKDLKRCFPSKDEVSDDASPALKDIRRRIRTTGDKVHTELNSISSSKRSYLQDSPVTMRDGRYCLPVKQEYRAKIPGIVHDQSSSGYTVFIEPSSVVSLNNRLRELSSMENEEIQKILSKFSERCLENIEIIRQDMDILSKLDFIFAKARLSKQMNATPPEFGIDGHVLIKQGRHPLLDPKKAVPIDVELGGKYTLLVITGPNTGGKTVSLKTVGLLTLMGQSGLHIPALEGSILSIFDKVFADIGDEQSIEQSLSTFSAHMTNISHILEEADENSLVLFDELGAGTDPVEGAALAIAILSFLKNKGTKIMATTHYSELKLYALSTDGVENAGCEFDISTLRPTYKLITGIPGKSNAFAIASKIGIPDEIVSDAKSRMNDDSIHFEDVISKMEDQKIQIEKDQRTINVYKEQIRSLKRDYELKTERLESKRSSIIEDARHEALSILKEAKATADSTIRDIQKNASSGNTKAMEQSRRLIGEDIKKNQQDTLPKADPTAKKESLPSDFKPGTRVNVLSLNLEGTVLTAPNANGNLTVKMGSLNSKVNIKDLEIADDQGLNLADQKDSNQKGSNTGKVKMSKSMSVSTQCNLIGKTVDEALPILEKYLDDAYLAHLMQVTIIHGKGTGALRQGVRDYLKCCNYVDSYRDGDIHEGGSGATIVSFK